MRDCPDDNPATFDSMCKGEPVLKNARFCLIGVVLALLLPAVPGQAEEYVGQIKAEKILVTTTAGNGQPHAYLETEHPEVTAMIVEIPPNAETGWHMHAVPVYAYVLAGNLEVALEGGKSLAFKSGEAIVEVQNLAHNGRNTGAETVRLAVFYTGEVGRANVIKVAIPTDQAEALSAALATSKDGV
jgi:quercetin dioxygenase-like cupin family protein